MDSTATTSDADLISEVVGGDVERFGVLMERYEQKLLRYVVYLIHDEVMARDVVQETFIKTYQNLRGYNPKHKFSSWIYRIAHNEAINAVKRHSREVDLENNPEPSQDSTIIRDIDQAILADDVADCLSKLESRQREILMLYYYENMKYDEISDVLHTPSSTVGVRIKRAREQLKSICEQKGIQR